MNHSPLPDELVQAFTETEYIVHNDPSFTMHIGKSSPDLKKLMADRNALSTAFITPCNPFSRRLREKENQVRLLSLKATLKRRGLICIDSIGQHPTNHWPGEVGVLVLGLDLEAAKSLSRHYEQHAFVWAAIDGVPQLVQP
jgi:hypothetical protein